MLSIKRSRILKFLQVGIESQVGSKSSLTEFTIAIMVNNTLNNGAVKKRTRMRRSRLEKFLILMIVAIAILLAFVNISILTTATLQESEDHHSVTNIHNANAARGFTVDDKLMRILRHVGIDDASQLSEEDRRLLPTWDQVVDRVGNDGPKILGLETCKAYRDNVPQGKRRLGVAGPFNSGTHYLHEVMSNNCIYKIPGKDTRGNRGVLHQVHWGKHQSPRFRLIHNTELGSSISRKNDAIKNQNDGKLDHPELPPELLELNQNVLPIVMVRDPFTWFQSMCKSRYSAHWYHIVPDHCPNFIANDVEKEWFYKKRPEVRKHYDGDPWKVDNVMNKANFTLDKKVSTRSSSFTNTRSVTPGFVVTTSYNSFHLSPT